LKERLIQFGNDGRLVGTFLEVDQDPQNGPRSRSLALLTFNAGLIPRTGPHRLWVKLARRVALIGLSSLRFDLNGQGDSANVSTTLPFEAQAVEDIIAAMDTIRDRTGIDRFILIGVCSGAALSYKAALRDRRVVGCAMIDIYMYPTWRTRWVTLHQRIPREGLFRIFYEAAKKRLRLLNPENGGTSGQQRYTNALPGLAKPTVEEFASGLQNLLDRQTQLLMIYTGGFLYHYNYEKQFADRFRAYKITGPLRVDFDVHIDHTVTEVSAQEYVINKLADWIKDQ
jgi:pimeloyl-ACP methyl ester carboxylesterase